MRCTDTNCSCLTHVDPSTHVPCCPFCRVPLTPAEPDSALGDCPNGRRQPPRRCPGQGRVMSADEWVWIHRDVFMAADLPPANGWQPITIREELL